MWRTFMKLVHSVRRALRGQIINVATYAGTWDTETKWGGTPGPFEDVCEVTAGFCLWVKKHTSKNLRFLDDFGMCSPVYEFRPEIRTKNKKWSRVDKAMFSPSRRMQRSYTIRLLAHPSRRSDLRCALSILRLSGKEHAWFETFAFAWK